MKRVLFVFAFLALPVAHAASECSVYVSEEYSEVLQESFSNILIEKAYEITGEEQASLYLSTMPIGFSDGPCGDFGLASYLYEARLKRSDDHSVEISAQYKDVANGERCANRQLAMEGAVRALEDCK